MVRMASDNQSEVNSGTPLDTEVLKNPFLGPIVKLDETNYPCWSQTFLVTIESHEKHQKLRDGKLSPE